MSSTWPVRTLLLIGLVIPLLAGCVPSSASSVSPRAARRQPQAANAAPTTTISWSVWGNDWELEIDRRVARTFESENPSIKVQIVHRPWEAYFTWLEAQWQSGTAPDVMFLSNVRGYATTGQLAPLDSYLQADRFDLPDFYPRLLDLFNYQGSYYGLPRDNDTKVIYYNRTLFADAGLPPPRPGWTWTDLRNAANRLVRRDAVGRPLVYGFAFESALWWRMWVWQNGGDILDDPLLPSRVRLDEPAAVEALTFLSDLIRYDRVTPPADVLQSSDRITELFRSGRLAMAFGGHGKVPLLAEEPNLAWDVAPLPAGRQRVNVAGGAGYTIWSGSPHKDAAWTFLSFLEGEKGQALFAESGLIVPARRSIREDNIFVRQQPYNVQVFADETEFGRPNLNIPQAGQINNLADAELAPVWSGQRSVDEALTRLVPQIKLLVER
jgi:multiple sugar transport system substrate-binding protein